MCDCDLKKLKCVNCNSLYKAHTSLSLSPSLSDSIRAVRLDWSPPGRPSGIMLGYEILRRTRRSCAVAAPVGEESAGVGEEKFRCSYVQCPAGLGVCGTSCFHPDSQVSVFFLRLPIEVFATQQQQQQKCGKKKKKKERTFAVFIDTLSIFFMAIWKGVGEKSGFDKPTYSRTE